MKKLLLKNKRGFTLIELMIVMSIIGILASIAVPNYRWGLIKARESVLSEHLYILRTTIDQYSADNGKYPDTLQDLVPKYLSKIPKDPFTGQEDWETIPPPVMPSDGSDVLGGVGDVKSKSDLIGINNIPYRDW